jgi:hypothetical protein
MPPETASPFPGNFRGAGTQERNRICRTTVPVISTLRFSLLLSTQVVEECYVRV